MGTNKQLCTVHRVKIVQRIVGTIGNATHLLQIYVVNMLCTRGSTAKLNSVKGLLYRTAQISCKNGRHCSIAYLIVALFTGGGYNLTAVYQNHHSIRINMNKRAVAYCIVRALYIAVSAVVSSYFYARCKCNGVAHRLRRLY